MDFIRIENNYFDELFKLHAAYKTEIGEASPSQQDLFSLKRAIESGIIQFYGCICDDKLVGICSVCPTYSTFNYERSGVFEDFYILPEARRQGIARGLAAYAWQNSGVKSMTVGCAPCDQAMYQAIGFRVKLGNLLAWEE